MTLSTPRTRHYLKSFDFERLFIEELGWDRHFNRLPILVDGHTFILQGFAEKRGVQIFLCQPDADGSTPDYTTRLKIEKQVTKSAYEHLIIFFDAAQSIQIWQWVLRRPGQPARYREHHFHPAHHSGDALIQKLDSISFSLDEEEGLTLAGVVFRLRDALDRDKVTKKFYDYYKNQHQTFLQFIKGITDQGDREWYASLMLNRLMFVYFLQRKGFLDSDRDYLKNRLEMVREKKGKDKFLTFYRYFLVRLFHEGFGQQLHYRAKDLDELLGHVPYLDGGLFELHELEAKHTGIDIPDKAFEKLFAFFDQYEWHLDTRPLRDDREINPDVLGYIFEKYVNQKQMGAYYTKEDITGYISKYTILPYVFDAARKKCAIAFESDSAVWRLLQNDPDRYIYPAVRKGVLDNNGDIIPLPEEIAAGIEEVSQREGWNHPADPEFALPTETWRELVARRQRCLEIRAKLQSGEISQINDLITYNLDICQFAEDAITNCEEPELLRAFFKAISTVTVLDPTCGSGAFLFAALNILEPLYEACLDRMQAFVDDLERSDVRHRPEKFSDFRRILNEIERHPNSSYFILKSIIINNLYGVDIMEEAVEICKLRLFLKLVAQVDKVGHLEPLPDIDFNIRAGNTLVGFATLEDVKRTITESLPLYKDQVARIVEDAEIVDRAFKRFHEMQSLREMDSREFADQKIELRERLKKLTHELDKYLALEYGIYENQKEKFAEWQNSHLPFHWFAEFFGIMNKGGFDVIIGNPPYLNLSSLKEYELSGYKTLKTRNLYAIVLERCELIIHFRSRQGYIVPVSSISTQGYLPLQEILNRFTVFASSYDDRPAHLFDGLDKNTLTILLLSISSTKTASDFFTTRLYRWNSDERHSLFSLIQYSAAVDCHLPGCIPKIGTKIETEIWSKLFQNNENLSSYYESADNHIAYYSRKINAFLQVLNFVPEVRDGKGRLRPPSEFKPIKLKSQDEAKSVFCVFNSSLFRWFIDAVTDGSHINRREIDNFPLNPQITIIKFPNLIRISDILSEKLRSSSEVRVMRYKHDTLSVQCIIPKHSKQIIDKIDGLLALYYGLSNEELDYVINYDIKYRMGSDVLGSNG